jgi:hypothetical protein
LEVGFLRTDRLVLRAIEPMNEDEAVNWALTSGDVEPKTVRPRFEGRAFGGTLLDGSTFTASNPAPSKALESNDHEMASAASTLSDGNMNIESEPSGELMMDNIDESFAVLEDEAGSSCTTCTYINLPGLHNCEMCEAPLPG